MNIRDLFEQVARGAVLPADAESRMRESASPELGFARIDLDRLRRCGIPEVVYCSGKTPEQITAVMRALHTAGQMALATRATLEQFNSVKADLPEAVYHPEARAITLSVDNAPEPVGLVAVICAGTTDIPTAEEAALTAEWMGARVERIFDVGIAGLHRLLNHLELLRKARVVVAAAGMEGALPSVTAGLLACPVIALPTSVGYGTSLGGMTALLAMLNSCAPGITVVNIDNGFGAGVAAAKINRMGLT